MRLQEQKENVWLIRHASQISVTQRKLRRYGAPVIGLVLCMRTNGVIQHLYRKTSFHQCDLRDPPEQRSVSWLFRGFGSLNAESRGDCNASQKYRTVDRKAAFIAGKRLPALSRRDRNRRITYPRTILPGCITPLGMQLVHVLACMHPGVSVCIPVEHPLHFTHKRGFLNAVMRTLMTAMAPNSIHRMRAVPYLLFREHLEVGDSDFPMITTICFCFH